MKPDQHRQHFGVGLGLEGVALLESFFFSNT